MNTPFSYNFQPKDKLAMSISYQNIPQDNPPLEKRSMIAIGNPIIDITADIDKESIQKYGLLWGQTIFANEKNIGYFDELEKRPEVTYTPGGSIQNTMRVASWCLNMDENSKNLFKLTMLGCVGNDLYKDKVENALKLNGVIPLLQVIPNVETSRCAVGVYKKERCLVPQIRASNNLSEEFIKNNEDKIFENDILLIEGYFLQEKFNICKYLCERFVKDKKTIIFTLSAVFMVQFHNEKIMEIANMADLIVCNLEEIEALGGKGSTIQETVEKAHKKLIPKNRILVVTAGIQGVFCSEFNYESNSLEYLHQCFPKFIKKEDIVDTNGAGDSFLGGFLAQYLKGKDMFKCCKAGNLAAGVILKNIGCTFPKDLKLKFQ